MKKKISAKDNLNLFFSAFLILAYIVCGYFFVNFANTQTEVIKTAMIVAVLAVFGLIIFYATRVGDGTVVKRFSVITLILLDIPALYVVLASIIPQLPLYDFLSANEIVTYMASVALGYGIPYTFISGFELAKEAPAETEVVEEDIEQEILSDMEEEETDEESEDTDEIVVEGVSADETEEEELSEGEEE